MAQTVEQLMVRIDATTEQLRRELKRADDSVSQSQRRIGVELAKVDKAFSGIARAATAAFAAIGGALAVRGIARANMEMQRIHNTLLVATGSSEDAAASMAFVRQEADRLGLGLAASASQFAKLSAAAKGTALEGQASRDIFTAVSEAMTVLGGSAEQTEGALTAIEQMISKGKVSAEELRGQLGERLPGAFQTAAKAMGVTTAELDKMLSNGAVTADVMLPRLAAELHKTFGPGAQRAAGSLQGAINRLDNAFFELVQSDGGLTQAAKGVDELATIFKDPDFKRSVDGVLGAMATGFAKAAKGASNLLQYMGFGLSEEQELFKEITGLQKEFNFLMEGWNGTDKAVLNRMNAINAMILERSKALQAVQAANGQGAPTALPAVTVTAAPLSKDEEALEKLREQTEKRLALIREGLMSERELEVARYEEKRAFLEATSVEFFEGEAERKALIEDLERQHQARLTEIDQQGANRRIQIEEHWASTVNAMRMGVFSQFVGLLRAMPNESRSVAIALIALEKGLAMAETFMSTQAAAMRAIAELGPIAGPPMAAKIEALGYTKMGLIAATGLMQAGSVGGGGSISGAGAVDSGSSAASSAEAPPAVDQQQGVTIIINGDVSGNDAELLLENLRGLINDSDHVFIERNSRQGRILMGS